MDACLPILDDVETVLKILALAGGVLYFFFKLLTGFFLFDLSINLNPERRPVAGSSTEDYLVIAVVLKRGELSAVELHDIRATVIDETGDMPAREASFKGLRRSRHKAHGSSIEIAGGEEDRLLRLRPREETQFSALVTIPKSAVARVEVSVLAKRLLLGFVPGKWKAVAHVLPLNTPMTSVRPPPRERDE